ncbi:MAG: hypothetical protein ACHEUT_00315 [Corynebacterium pyruviciproducens]|uniref:hypothetical protein n=1 Tax=Corynebacterium pyruviciproducens TaxID=598660 RepID=UPI002454FC13|nr:hypothetical protein [Corynebacterium pyruviciproducens]MDH4658151.1 hypothetical protein [Corynebacterium pyruviciproducens]
MNITPIVATGMAVSLALGVTTGGVAVAADTNINVGYQCVNGGVTYTNPLVWSAPVVGIIGIYAAVPEEMRAEYGLPVSQNVRDLLYQVPQLDRGLVDQFVTNGTLAAFSIFAFIIGALASTPGFYNNCVTDIHNPKTGDKSETTWDSSKSKLSSDTSK